MATEASQSRSGFASTSTMSKTGSVQQQRPSGISLSTSKLSQDPSGNKSRNHIPSASRSRLRQGRNASASNVQTAAASGRRRRFNDTREIDVLISEVSAASRKGGLGSPYGSMLFTPSTDSFANGAPAGYTSPYIPGSPTALSQTSLRGPGRARFGRPGALSSLSQTDVTGISKISKSESGLCRIAIPEGMGIGVTDSPYPIFTPPDDFDPMKEGNALRGPAMTSNPDLLSDSEMFTLGRPQIPPQSSNPANQDQGSKQFGLLPGYAQPTGSSTMSDSQTPVGSVSPNPDKPQTPALAPSVKDTADDALPSSQPPLTSTVQAPKKPVSVSTPPRPSATSQPNKTASTPAQKSGTSKLPTTPGRYFGFRHPSQPAQNQTSPNGDEKKRKGLFSGFFKRIKTPSKSKPPAKMPAKNYAPPKSEQKGASNLPGKLVVTNKVEPKVAPVKPEFHGEAPQPTQTPKDAAPPTQVSTVKHSTPSPAPQPFNEPAPSASLQVPSASSAASSAPASQAANTNAPATPEPLSERVMPSGGAVPTSSTPPKPSAAPKVAPLFSDPQPDSSTPSNAASVQTSQVRPPVASQQSTGAAPTNTAPEASSLPYVRHAYSVDASVPSTQHSSDRRTYAAGPNSSPYMGMHESADSYGVTQEAPASSIWATTTGPSTQAPASTVPTMSATTGWSYTPADAPISSYPDWSSYTTSHTYYQSPPSERSPVPSMQNSQPKSPVDSFTRPNVSTLQAKHPIYTQTSSASASYPQAASISRMPSTQGMASEYQQHPALASSLSPVMSQPSPHSNTTLPSYLFNSGREQQVHTTDAPIRREPVMAPPTTEIYSAPSPGPSSHLLSPQPSVSSGAPFPPQASASSATYLHHPGSGQSMSTSDRPYAANPRGQETFMLSNGLQLRDPTWGSSLLNGTSGDAYSFPSKSSSFYDSATEYDAPSPTDRLAASKPSLWESMPLRSSVNNSAELPHTQKSFRHQAQSHDRPHESPDVLPHGTEHPTVESRNDDLSRVSKHSSELDGSKGTGLNLSPSLQAIVSLSLADEPQFTADVDVLG